MPREIAIEAFSLYLPLCLAAILVIVFKPSARVWVAILMASTWQLATLPWLNLLAANLKWWQFHSDTPSVLGLPASFYIGWVILWGVCAVIIQQTVHKHIKLPANLCIVITIILFFGFDVATMRYLQPVLTLQNTWLEGEILLISIGLIPSLLIARSVITYQWLTYRSIQISFSFIVLLLTVLPFITYENALDDSITICTSRHPLINWVFTTLIFFTAIPGAAAVRQFITRGNGTPIPFDPPTKIVTDGVYSYCPNAMQLSMLCVLLLWGGMLQSWICFLLALISIIYAQGIAIWSESADMKKRFSNDWKHYQLSVPRWRFSLYPYLPMKLASDPAKLYISKNCHLCQQVKHWFNKHNLHGLNLCEAEDYKGNPLTRITYIYAASNTQATGVNAIACAFQHIHLGYAYIGWLIQIPILNSILQSAVDASGGGKITPRHSDKS